MGRTRHLRASRALACGDEMTWLATMWRVALKPVQRGAVEDLALVGDRAEHAVEAGLAVGGDEEQAVAEVVGVADLAGVFVGQGEIGFGEAVRDGVEELLGVRASIRLSSNANAGAVGFDAADLRNGERSESFGECGVIAGGSDDDEADAHVEDAMHLFVGDVAELLEPGEDALWLPCRAVDDGAETCGEDARGVFDEAAAGDVRHALDGDAGIERATDGRDVVGVGFEERCRRELRRRVRAAARGCRTC